MAPLTSDCDHGLQSTTGALFEKASDWPFWNGLVQAWFGTVGQKEEFTLPLGKLGLVQDAAELCSDTTGVFRPAGTDCGTPWKGLGVHTACWGHALLLNGFGGPEIKQNYCKCINTQHSLNKTMFQQNKRWFLGGRKFH